MLMKKCLSALAVFGASAILSAGTPLVAGGDKIAFLGDSITAQGNRNRAGYVNLVMDGLAANGIAAVKIPAGVGGNKSNQMLERLDKDVLSKKPQVMILSCGVNDVWHQFYKKAQGVPLDEFKDNIGKIIDKALAANAKVVVMTATMIMENPNDQRNQRLVEYNEALRALAAEKNCVLADQNTAMQKKLADLKKAYPTVRGNLLTRDGVHMQPMGDKMMAMTLLAALGLDGEQLKKAEAAIDAVPVQTPALIPLGLQEKISCKAWNDKKPVILQAGEYLEAGAKGALK